MYMYRIITIIFLLGTSGAHASQHATASSLSAVNIPVLSVSPARPPLNTSSFSSASQYQAPVLNAAPILLSPGEQKKSHETSLDSSVNTKQINIQLANFDSAVPTKSVKLSLEKTNEEVTIPGHILAHSGLLKNVLEVDSTLEKYCFNEKLAIYNSLKKLTLKELANALTIINNNDTQATEKKLSEWLEKKDLAVVCEVANYLDIPVLLKNAFGKILTDKNLNHQADEYMKRYDVKEFQNLLALPKEMLSQINIKSIATKTLGTHIKPINMVEWSPDGSYIATYSSHDSMCIWDAKTCRLLRKLKRTHSAYNLEMAWSPDSTMIAIASSSGNSLDGYFILVVVYDAVDAPDIDFYKGTRQTFWHTDYHYDDLDIILWSSDSKFVNVVAHNIHYCRGNVTRRWMWDMALSENQNPRVYSSEQDIEDTGWRVFRRGVDFWYTHLFFEDRNGCIDLTLDKCCSPNNKYKVAFSEDEKALLISDEKTGECIKTINSQTKIVTFSWSRDGESIAWTSSNAIYITKLLFTDLHAIAKISPHSSEQIDLIKRIEESDASSGFALRGADLKTFDSLPEEIRQKYQNKISSCCCCTIM